MSENREKAEIRDALAQLTTEIKLTRIVFAAIREEIEEMIARDGAELSPGYTTLKREMN